MLHMNQCLFVDFFVRMYLFEMFINWYIYVHQYNYTLNTPDYKHMCYLLRAECTEACKTQRKELENEVAQQKRKLESKEEQVRKLEHEIMVSC